MKFSRYCTDPKKERNCLSFSRSEKFIVAEVYDSIGEIQD